MKQDLGRKTIDGWEFRKVKHNPSIKHHFDTKGKTWNYRYSIEYRPAGSTQHFCRLFVILTLRSLKEHWDNEDALIVNLNATRSVVGIVNRVLTARKGNSQ